MAYNSLIADKYTECIDCADGIEKPTIAGRCKAYHYSIYRKKKMLERQKEKSKVRSLIQSPENKKMLVENDLIEDENLELFFRYCAIELSKSPWCEECGEWIPPSLYRSATAHILPKRKEYGFSSVSSHPKNKLFLCTINGCHDKTHTWSKFATMKVWPIAVAAFKEIYPFIAIAEKKNIPQILLDTL